MVRIIVCAPKWLVAPLSLCMAAMLTTNVPAADMWQTSIFVVGGIQGSVLKGVQPGDIGSGAAKVGTPAAAAHGRPSLFAASPDGGVGVSNPAPAAPNNPAPAGAAGAAIPVHVEEAWLVGELDRQSSRYAAAFLEALTDDSKAGGILTSATSVPAVGRLVRTLPSGGEAASCSGILIGARTFLTAAHCFCEKGNQHWENAAECTAHGAPTARQSTIFFAGVGVYTASKPPIIHDRFALLGSRTAAAQSALADLAIVELDDAPPIPWVAVGATSAKGRFVNAGFGALDLTPAAKKKMGIDGGPYREGLGALGYPILQTCPAKVALTDVLCAKYNTDDSGLATATAVCGGDSGGPLVHFDASGGPGLVGIVSGRHSQGGVEVCGFDDAVNSIFIDVSKYSDWIARNSPAASRPSAAAVCKEGLVSWARSVAWDVVISNPAVFERVSVVLAQGFKDTDPPRLLFEPDGPCVRVAGNVGTAFCRTQAGHPLTLTVEGAGLAQIVACRSTPPPQ